MGTAPDATGAVAPWPDAAVADAGPTITPPEPPPLWTFQSEMVELGCGGYWEGVTGYRQAVELLTSDQIGMLEQLNYVYNDPPEQCGGQTDESGCTITVTDRSGEVRHAETNDENNRCSPGWRIDWDRALNDLLATMDCSYGAPGEGAFDGRGYTQTNPFPIAPHDGCLHHFEEEHWYSLQVGALGNVTLLAGNCRAPVAITLFEGMIAADDGGMSDASSTMPEGGLSVLATSSATDGGEACATLTHSFADTGSYIVHVDFDTPFWSLAWLRAE